MSTSHFDAAAARALSRRSHGASEILAEMKQAIVEAAEHGEFEATVALPDAVLVPAGQSVNSTTFLIDHLQSRELPAWVEAAGQAARAGYALRPSWVPMGMGAGCDGVTLAWSMVIDAPQGTLRLMSAHDAYRMAMGARAQHQWVEKALEAVRKAALAGRAQHAVLDTESPDAPAWALRRELLKRAGFSTDLLRTDAGSQLVIRW